MDLPPGLFSPGKSTHSMDLRETVCLTYWQVLELPFAHLPWPSLTRELPQPGTQQLPSGIRVGLFSVMFGKQVKGFDVPARGLELLWFRSSVAILVKTCLLRGEHLLKIRGCGHHPEAWDSSTVAHVSFSPPLSPTA